MSDDPLLRQPGASLAAESKTDRSEVYEYHRLRAIMDRVRQTFNPVRALESPELSIANDPEGQLQYKLAYWEGDPLKDEDVVSEEVSGEASLKRTA